MSHLALLADVMQPAASRLPSVDPRDGYFPAGSLRGARPKVILVACQGQRATDRLVDDGAARSAWLAARGHYAGVTARLRRRAGAPPLLLATVDLNSATG
jgi:hypothetical protein